MAKLILDYASNKSLLVEKNYDAVLDIVKNHKDIDKAIKDSKDYLTLFNLSETRTNILDPIGISEDDVCLEIGSECGAITSGILKHTNHLDCIEISKQKSEINFERNSNSKELNIYVGDLEKIPANLSKKYSKILLIGSFKHARDYLPNSENPYADMLRIAKSLLTKDGSLFIAIENKYGMKYFSGAKEDDTGNAFESIVGYKTSDLKTFSCFELREMIKRAGFSKCYFYYPFPDYKFPNIIFSEDFLPDNGSLVNVGHSLDQDRAVLFNEDEALLEASKSKVLEVFSNSFLIKVGF